MQLSHRKHSELVVLVDENNREIGAAPKAMVHSKNTPLHRGFSVYLFASEGEFLIQQRKKEKITWGGFWSNSYCGHPAPGEEWLDATKRRAREELGIDVHGIKKIADFRYRVEYNNVVENEICPIFVGLVSDKDLSPDPKEIEDIKWLRWNEFLDDLERRPEMYSPWTRDQVSILLKSIHFHEWLASHGIRLS